MIIINNQQKLLVTGVLSISLILMGNSTTLPMDSPETNKVFLDYKDAEGNKKQVVVDMNEFIEGRITIEDMYKEKERQLQEDNLRKALEERKLLENKVPEGYQEDEYGIYRTVTAVVTAYAPYDNKSGTCNDGDPYTSTGTMPKHGTMAADPKRVPYGTKVFVPGYGLGQIEDTGGALRKDKKNIRIDIFVKTYKEAIQFGKQTMEIKIYDYKP